MTFTYIRMKKGEEDMNLYIFFGVTVPMLYIFFMIYELFHTVYQEKYRLQTYILGYILAYILQSCVAALRIPLLTLASFSIIVICIAVFGYSGSSRNKVIYTIMCIFYLVLLDAVVVPIVSAVTGESISAILSSDEKFFLTGIITFIVGICTFKPVIRILTGHKVALLTRGQELFIILLGCFELGTLHSILQLKDYRIIEADKISIGISTGFVVLNIYLLVLFESVSRNNELKIRNSLLEQRMYMEEENYERLKTQNESYRKIMHDIKSHVGVIQQTSGADKEYCQQLLELLQHHELPFACSNPVLNAIINDRILFCENHNIEFVYQIEDVDFQFMRKMDITTIFMNLLNNAAEASIELEPGNRRIEITIKEVQKHIVVVIKNRYKKKSQSLFQEGISGKKGHMGLGLDNVRAALERYHSELGINSDEENFVARFIIRP